MQESSRRKTVRRGVSLLEVTIGSLMAGIIAVMASGVAFDVSRHLAANIAETQIAAEARLAIESFRRDFGGALPEVRSGQRRQWRLVGRLIPNVNELRLCFDADQDASPDWIAPDRVITYWLQGDQLVRFDAVSGNSYTVARYVDDVQFVVVGNEINVSIFFELGRFRETYSFVTADLP
jgi:type II secretory pathway pseudopilin PulG